MIDFLLSVSTLSGILISMVLATVVGLMAYGISYRLICRHGSDEFKGPTENLFGVVGVLVGLMLSLAFSEVVAEKRTIEKAVAREAVAIADLFNGLQQFDAEGTREIRSDLINYVQAIIKDDWAALANDKLGQQTGFLRKQISHSIIELDPNTEVQKELWSRLLSDLDAVSNYRLIRLDNALAKPPVYVYTVIFGFLVTMACFGVYLPQPRLVALASLYTVFVGLVLYLILALSDPFQGGFGVSPDTFEHLVETLQSESG